MKTNLLFDFTIDKATKTVTIVREFDASLSDVWDAFTKKEILDQWVAPKPFLSKTRSMDFKVGGRRLYAMVNAEGQEMGWQVQEYTSISPGKNFKYTSSFADKDGTPDPQWPGSKWDLSFSEEDGKTKVTIVITNESLARMEKMIEMGFREGFTASLKNLDGLLEK
jgi:uncharacterized protein YndB with AHSA1/START domain